MDRRSVSSVSVLMIMSILLLSGGLAIATHIDCYKTCMKICPFQRKYCEKLCTERCHRAAAAAVADHRYYCKLGCSLEKCTKFGRGIYIFIYLSILYCLFLSLSLSVTPFDLLFLMVCACYFLVACRYAESGKLREWVRKQVLQCQGFLVIH